MKSGERQLVVKLNSRAECPRHLSESRRSWRRTTGSLGYLLDYNVQKIILLYFCSSDPCGVFPIHWPTFLLSPPPVQPLCYYQPKHLASALPAPGVLTVTRQGSQLVIGERVVQVVVVGVIKHCLDSLSVCDRLQSVV